MTKTNYSAKRHQGGFSLIDVLLALGVVILISGITLSGIRRTNESNQAKAVGEQIKSVGTALNTYVSLRYDTLVTAVPGTDDVGSPGTASDPGPRSCVCTVGTGACAATGNIKICTISSETLRRNGLLPSNFSGINAYGSPYEYRIRVQPQGGSTVIVDGLVWTDDAYTMEGEERFDLLGQAMMVAGADSGMTRSSMTNVEGFNGAWTENGMGVNRLGVLAYRVGYNSFGYAAYLRLSGGEMLGDIDMGGQQIFNAGVVKADILAADRVQVHNGVDGIIFSDAVDSATDDAVAAAAATDPRIGTTGGALVMRSDAPIEMTTSLGTRAGVQMGALNAETGVISGALTANSLTLAAAPAATPGGISAQGTIITTNYIRGNTVLAGTGTGNIYARMANVAGATGGGAIYLNSNATGTAGSTVGLMLNSSTNTITMGTVDLELTGGIRAAGTTGTQGIITADRQLVSGANAIVIDSTITPSVGAACSGGATMLGRVARASEGTLAQCIAENLGAGTVYNWRAMSSTGSSIVTNTAGATVCTGAGATPGPLQTVACPAGGVSLSGGYVYQSGAPRRAPLSSYRAGSTGWTIEPGPTIAFTGDTTTTAQTCWRAFVVCSL
jgi:type II secretory pathway pseudopilin PulG